MAKNVPSAVSADEVGVEGRCPYSRSVTLIERKRGARSLHRMSSESRRRRGCHDDDEARRFVRATAYSRAALALGVTQYVAAPHAAILLGFDSLDVRAESLNFSSSCS